MLRRTAVDLPPRPVGWDQRAAQARAM